MSKNVKTLTLRAWNRREHQRRMRSWFRKPVPHRRRINGRLVPLAVRA